MKTKSGKINTNNHLVIENLEPYLMNRFELFEVKVGYMVKICEGRIHLPQIDLSKHLKKNAEYILVIEKKEEAPSLKFYFFNDSKVNLSIEDIYREAK